MSTVEKEKTIRLTRAELRRRPYRGILSEIAKERGVTHSAIQNALWRDRNETIWKILIQKVAARRNALEMKRSRIINAALSTGIDIREAA